LGSCFADCAAEPFTARLTLYLRWSAAVTLLFLVTYGSTNWLAARSVVHFRLYFNWELAIPFVPWMIWVYLSLQIFLALPLFVLDAAGISRLGQTFALATLAAGAMHLALPTDLGWRRPLAVPGYPIFDRFFSIDRPHNLAPSLHVAYSTLTLLVIWSAARGRWLRTLSAVWAGLLVCSVSLIHQHHLVDIASGIVLAALCSRWFQAGGSKSPSAAGKARISTAATNVSGFCRAHCAAER
jgi:membrane-associated phospholipid phosphatase